MGHTAKVYLEVELPDDLARLTLPDGVDRRLQALLDKQDQGGALTQDEREEAEGLADLADLLSLLKLRTERKPGPPSRAMTVDGIPRELQRLVRERAQNRCEYCGLWQQGQEATFHIDHGSASPRGR